MRFRAIYQTYREKRNLIDHLDGPDQIISGVAGVMTNFIIVANTDVEGEWTDPQPKRFPYN